MAEEQGVLLGKSIVVTGDLEYFPEKGPYPQRIEFRKLVEKHGGKLTSAVSGKTSYLVCNDTHIATVKVQQAREKNIPILTEKEFLSMIGESIPLKGATGKVVTFSDYHGTDTELVIPEGVTDIADGTFSRCDYLQKITIPETVERMGRWAIYRCDNLRCITLLGKVREGVASGVPRNQMLELVAPDMPIGTWKRYGLMFAAGLGFLTHRSLYTDAAIVAEYEEYVGPRCKKAMELLWETDPVEAVRFCAEKGKIRPANFAADYLEPAQKANATQCVAWLLNWQNENITPEMREKQWQREMKALTKEKAPTLEEMRKLWDYSVREDGTICLGRYKEVDPNVCVPKRIGKQRVTAIGNWTFFHKRKLQSVAISKNITSIGEDAFYGCENLTIYAPGGSYAESYAKAHNIPFVAD